MSPEVTHLSRSLRLHCLQLSKPKYRQLYGEMIIEGSRIIQDALESNVQSHFCVVDSSLIDKHERLLLQIQEAGIQRYSASQKEFESLSSTIHSQGILAVVTPPKQIDTALLSRLPAPALVVVLDHVNDPGNLGTIIRTCDWFGVKAIFLSEGSADIYNPKVVRASMGSIFRMGFCYFDTFEQIAKAAKESSFTIFAADVHSTPISDAPMRAEKGLLLFGNEAHGISDEFIPFIDERFSIPRYGDAESLNLAVSCGIVLSEFVKHQQT